MATISVQTTQVIDPSAKTLSDIEGVVARIAGAQDNPGGVGARDAIHLALDWLLEHNWEYYHVQASDFETVADTSEYLLPTRIKSIQSLRATGGSARPLKYIREDHYDRVVFEQTTTGLPTMYTLTRQHESGVLKLLPTPEGVETMEIDIYKAPVKPTSGANPIDIASWMERPLILQAQALVGTWRGLRSERTSMLFAAAEDAKRGAIMRDSDVHDEDVRLIPGEEHLRRQWPVDHPDFCGDYWT